VRTAPKVALSLLLSILLFSGLAAAAYAGFFNILETRFYQPAVIASMEEQLEATADALKTWHSKNMETFAQFVGAEPVQRSLLPNQSAQDIFDRSNLAGTLLADMPALTGIRIIDAGDTAIAPENDRGTRRIHFSTFREDILKKEDLQIAYENYGKNEADLPFNIVSVPDGSPPKLIIDRDRDLFQYCFPFYDAFSSWRGTAVFYVSARAAAQYLIGENLFRISDSLVLLGDSTYTVSGIVTGMPRAGQQILGEAVIERWQRKDFTTDRIVSTDDSGWVLLSRETGDYGFIGQLVQEKVFTFPQSVRILFLAISFLTLFLVIFLLFNLKQDEMMLIRNRIRRFHAHLLNELIDRNEEVHWDEIQKNLANRKNDIASEIKKSFGRRMNRKHGSEIDALLDKSWDEILSALGQQESRKAGVTSTDELRDMLEQVLQNNSISLNLTGAAPVPKTPKRPAIENRTEKPAEAENAEELDEMEGLDEVESLEDAETVEALDEVESLEDAETVEELDEVESLEDAETMEELDEVEEAETADEVESLEDAETVEELDEVEESEAETYEPDLPGEFEAVDQGAVTDVLSDTEELAILDEVPEALSEMDSIIDGFSDSDDEDEPFNLPEVEAEEVVYLDGEWEPALLEVASEEELARFIEEKIPDSILVYNFEEPQANTATGKTDISEAETEVINAVSITGLDFTSLDSSETEDAPEVDYIDSFLFSQAFPLRDDFADTPVFEFLEVLGDEEPTELVDIVDDFADEDGSVTNRDGLFLVTANPSPATGTSIDPEFQKLVDSVLL